MEKPVYTVEAGPDVQWRSLQCVQVPAAIGQVAELNQAALTIRAVIAWSEGIDPGPFDVELIEKGAGGS